ncbi:outer membrane beta-barrel family protein [Longitalea arenae]|uniref:outer membrane beta-barrel family protein n=1 Tax=Longitalea arenae TaxID=2812558 RepID=UPI0019670013|nr:outer membrane beta-barrel family protein [Longitalea arenae]
MRIAILLISTLFFTEVYTQTIKGKIIDKNSEKALPYATIVIKKDTVVYRTAITDSLGIYSITDLAGGNYSIEFSFINYQKATMSVFLTHDTLLKTIALTPLPGQLKEVTLTARKPLIERKADRLIFNVANNVNVVGTDALELLGKTPQIRVDKDAISMIGKGSVRVMINDKILQMPSESLAAYLKSIPAESVESIEVISNPPAMYSAEGSSGLVNIVLKKKREPGYTGTVNLNLTTPPSPRVNPNLNINYNKKNIRYYGSINAARGYQNPAFTTTILYPDRTQDAKMKEKEESQFAGGQLGFDADLTKTASLGISFNIFYSFPYQTNNIRTVFTNNKTKKTDSISEQQNKNKIAYRSKSSNIHYVKYFDTVRKKKLVVDADWFSNGFDFPNKIKSTMTGADGVAMPDRTSETFSNNTLASTIYSLNAVATLPTKKYEVNIGGKINFIKSSNDVSLIINNIGRNVEELNTSNAFSFTENTQALFINYKRDLGKKWSFQTGLRAENTQTRGEASYLGHDSINKNTYFELFPTAYLSHRVSDKYSISANYGRRINRPGFNSFNPYPQYSSQYMYSEGNPYLLPSISNNFELNQTIGDLDLSAQYSFSNEQVGRIGEVDSATNITITRPSNFLSTRSFVVSTYYTFNKIKWLQSMNEVDVYWNKSISRSSLTPTIAGWAGSIRSDNSIFFNKARTIIGGLNFYYQFPEIIGINKFKSWYYLDVSGKYLLLNNKLQLSFRISDIFKTLNLPFSSTVNNIVTTNMVNNDSRRFYISARYTFGNSKLKKGEAHSGDSNNNRAF